MRLLCPLLMLCFGTPTMAADNDVERAIFVPTRVSSRLVTRNRTAPAALLEGGLQVWRNDPFTLDLATSFTPPHALDVGMPWYTVASADAVVDLGIQISSFVSTGPSVGGGIRFFGQQGLFAQAVPMGLVGWSLDLVLVRSPKLGVEMTTKAMFDTVAIDLVREFDPGFRLPPIEAQFGLRLVFGHGPAS